MDEDRQRDIIRAYKIGRLNREEAIDELMHLDPNLVEPVLEILLNAVTRLNVVEINKSEKWYGIYNPEHKRNWFLDYHIAADRHIEV